MESRKITVEEWDRLCLALMGPMKRSFSPEQWEQFSSCVLADGAKDAMEECEAKVRRAAASSATAEN